MVFGLRGLKINHAPQFGEKGPRIVRKPLFFYTIMTIPPCRMGGCCLIFVVLQNHTPWNEQTLTY